MAQSSLQCGRFRPERVPPLLCLGSHLGRHSPPIEGCSQTKRLQSSQSGWFLTDAYRISAGVGVGAGWRRAPPPAGPWVYLFVFKLMRKHRPIKNGRVGELRVRRTNKKNKINKKQGHVRSSRKVVLAGGQALGAKAGAG